MKNIFQNKSFILLITAIIFISGTVAATTFYQANQVSYMPSDTNWNITNVKEALDALYDKTSKNNMSEFTASIKVIATSSVSPYPTTLSNPGYKYAKFVFYDLYQRMNVYFDDVLYFTFNAYDTGEGTKTLNNVDISNVSNIKFEPVYVNQVNRVGCDVTFYN